jgi:hypothetical protein
MCRIGGDDVFVCDTGNGRILQIAFQSMTWKEGGAAKGDCVYAGDSGAGGCEWGKGRTSARPEMDQ